MKDSGFVKQLALFDDEFDNQPWPDQTSTDGLTDLVCAAGWGALCLQQLPG
jgi:hypothetical protein